MKTSIDNIFNTSLNIFIIAIVSLRIFGIGNYYQMVLLCLLLIIPAFVLYFNNIEKKDLLFFVGFILPFFFFLPSINAIVYDGYYAYAIMVFLSSLTGLMLAKYFHGKHVSFDLSYFTLIILVHVYILTQTNFGQTEHLNRTYYTIPFTVLFASSVLFKETSKSKVFLYILPLLSLSIISYSRTMVVATLFILVIYTISTLTVRKAMFLVCLVSTVTITLLNLVSIDTLSFRPIETMLDKGLQSGRFQMWLWYLNHVNYEDLLLGSNPSIIEKYLDLNFFGDGKAHSIHNSFLQMIIRMGIFPLLALLCITLSSIFLLGKRLDLVFYLALVILFLKASTDSVFFGDPLDFLIFFIVFRMSYESKFRRGELPRKYTNKDKIPRLA